MIQLYLQKIHCEKGTSELGQDEPYVIVSAVDLASTVPLEGFSVPLPAFDVVAYRFGDVGKGETRFAPGPEKSFWGIYGQPDRLTDPDDVIVVVSLMENDDGDVEALRGMVKVAISASVFSSLAASRAIKVEALMRDIYSAMGLITGAPNFDDRIGVAELRFSADELGRAEAGDVVERAITLRGDGGRYKLVFAASNSESRNPEIEALSTRPGATSLYVMGLPNAQDANGIEGSQVWTKFFPDPNKANGWSDWIALGPNVFPKDATVAAVSTAAGATSLYVVGLLNAQDASGIQGSQVWTKFFPDPGSGNGWSDWIALGPNVFPKYSRVAALSLTPGATSLYVMGLPNAQDTAGINGAHVWTRFFPDQNKGNGWSDWIPLGPNVF